MMLLMLLLLPLLLLPLWESEMKPILFWESLRQGSRLLLQYFCCCCLLAPLNCWQTLTEGTAPPQISLESVPDHRTRSVSLLEVAVAASPPPPFSGEVTFIFDVPMIFFFAFWWFFSMCHPSGLPQMIIRAADQLVAPGTVSFGTVRCRCFFFFFSFFCASLSQ